MSQEQENYLLLCSAEVPTSADSEGIIVASDLTQEWLLPWWWDNYSPFNNYPVMFVDLGMSSEMQQWCKERGVYVQLQVPGLFVAEKKEVSPVTVSSWEGKYGNKFWGSRQAWFRKPLACLQSPYKNSLWIDLDCEVKGPLKNAFDFCSHPSGLSVVRERLKTEEVSFNSGVIAFQKGARIIRDWALKSLTDHLNYPGDQDILVAIIKNQNIQVGDLPEIFNSSRFNEPNAKDVIIHWHGPNGKSVISHQIMKKNLPI